MYAYCNLYVHQIFGTFMYVDTNSSVRSWQILYVNYVLQYVNGNADHCNWFRFDRIFLKLVNKVDVDKILDKFKNYPDLILNFRVTSS